MAKLRVGFVGLGLMGNPMAKNILKRDYPLSVWNRTKSKAQEFKKLRAQVVASPSDLALESDIVITMVTGPKEVRDVLFGKKGLIHGLDKKQKLTVVDMSTIGPKAAKEIAVDLEKYGVGFIDAPVTGSVVRAKTGELTIFAGGDKRVFNKVKPVLSVMGKTVHYIGPSGSGQAVKLVNNLLVAETVSALAEAMLLADKLGLPRKKAIDALSDVPAVSPFMKLKMPNMAKDKHPVAFSVANMRKDLALALEEIKKDSKKIPVLAHVHKLYSRGVKRGFSNHDISAVLRVISENTKK